VVVKLRAVFLQHCRFWKKNPVHNKFIAYFLTTPHTLLLDNIQFSELLCIIGWKDKALWREINGIKKLFFGFDKL